MKLHRLRTQQGVTLVELLVVIAIMGVVLIPVTMLMYTTLYTQKEVSERNELQHEARLIMERISTAMKDGAEWCAVGSNLVLKAKQAEESEHCTGADLLRYEPTSHSIRYVQDGANMLLSAHISSLELEPEPNIDNMPESQEVHIVLEKNGRSYEFTTTITYQRF